MPESKILLSVVDARVAYGKRPILKGISFSLESGQHLAVLGVSGSGKTTLLRCISGVQKPDSGRIYIGGKDVAELRKSREMARNAAAVSQMAPRPEGMLAGEYALLGRYPWISWFGLYSDEDYEIADESLASAGLAAFADRKIETLSGGEWQRAALARALAQIKTAINPLLLLDEFAANLDLASSMRAFSLLKGMIRNGCGVVSAMHDCNLAAIFCDLALGIRDGRQIFFGRLREVFNEENLSELYGWPVGVFIHPDLGSPQIFPRAT